MPPPSLLRRSGRELSTHPLSATDNDERPSIAVLLCANFSPNAEDAFRAQGIHEEILLHLQRISSNRSISRTSVLRFSGDPPPVMRSQPRSASVIPRECADARGRSRNHPCFRALLEEYVDELEH
jgi:TolB-like protein